MNKKTRTAIIIITFLLIIVWWFFPRSAIPHKGVSSVHISNGMNGCGCDLNTPEEIQTFLEVMHGSTYIRTLPHLFSSGGYSFIVYFYDDDMNDIGSFVLQGGHRGQVDFANVHFFDNEELKEYLGFLTEIKLD